MKQRQLSRAQRIVTIIGLGFAFDAFGQWLMTIGARANFGWVAYAPLSNQSAPSLAGGLHPWVRFVIWMILIALWTGAAVLLLSERSTSRGEALTHGI
jgi:heme/copper-type cytochrome/quinol oxidase subunit 1